MPIVWVGVVASLAPAQGGEVYTWQIGSGNWSGESNWDGGGSPPPDVAGEAAIVPEGPALSIALDMSPTIDWFDQQSPNATLNLGGWTLTTLMEEGFVNHGTVVANNGAATIAGNLHNTATGEGMRVGWSNSLTLTGPNVTNDDLIIVNTEQANATTNLNIDGAVSLGGSGTLRLNQSSSRAQLNTTEGSLLTQQAGHTIEGQGRIHAALVNDGTVDANVDGRTLELITNGKINNGTLRASNGASMNIGDIAINQSGGGTIVADAASVQLVGGAAIIGGRLSTSNDGVIANNAGNNTIADVTNDGQLHVDWATGLSASGDSLTNNGTITINPQTANAATSMTFDGDVDLQGTGRIVLNHTGPRAQLNSGDGRTATQGTGHTIRGAGQINAAVVNRGLVEADRSGNPLVLQANDKVNEGTLRAIGGAFLDIVGINVDQSGGGEIVADGATVRLGGGVTINGGTFATVDDGVVQNAAGTNTLNNVQNLGAFHVAWSTETTATGDALTNEGTIVINPTQVNAATSFTIGNDMSLQGSGELVLNHSTNRAQLLTAEGATLTHEADHAIRGTGQVHAGLINHGLVKADRRGNALELLTRDKVNNGTMRAVGGAYLDVGGIGVDQTAGGELVADAATVRLTGGTTVTGGTLRTSEGGVIHNTGGVNTLNGVVNLGRFDVEWSTTATLAGEALTNDGTVRVNPTASNATTTVQIDNDLRLGGTGEIVLGETGDRARITAAGDVTLTQENQHRIRGAGRIHAALDNRGLVLADRSGRSLDLVSHDKRNSGMMRAQNGSTLYIAGVEVAQTASGAIEADGATVQLGGGATIAGGTLDTTGGGVITNYNGINTLQNVTNRGLFHVRWSTSTLVTGDSLTNAGTIVVNPTGVNAATELRFGSDVVLGGSGEVVLNQTTSRAQLNSDAGFTVTQQAGHTIRGKGQINASLINHGDVVADRNGAALDLLASDKTNHGTMAARSGGVLDVHVGIDGIGGWHADGGTVRFNPGVIASTTGPIRSFNNGLIELTNADLSGADLLMNQTGRLSVGSSITILDDVLFAMTEENRWSWDAGSVLAMTGGTAEGCNTASWAMLEAGGLDSGPSVGYSNNFDLSIVEIGDDAAVVLVDAFDNGNRGGPDGNAEAVYMDALTLGTNAVLNLNGLHLYVGGAQVTAGPFDGGMVVDDALPLFLLDSQISGTVDLADFAELQACFTGAGGGPFGAGCDRFNVDCDDDIDLADYEVFYDAFTGPR